MSRRASLPGADELFRATTGGSAERAAPASSDRQSPAEPAAAEQMESAADSSAERDRHPVPRRRKSADRRPTGRERHDEKITVYCSADELIDIERARLALRGDYGIAVDRGRIVREAISIVLLQLEEHGEQSPLVQRLQRR